VTGRVHPVRVLTFGAGAHYLDIKTGPGAKAPSIETLFTSDTAPGLGTEPTYVRTRAFAQLDWRQPPGYTGSGGLYRVELQQYDERNDSNLSFRSLEGEVVQLFPFLRANWVIAVRGLVTVTDTDAGDIVPFYMLPSLGGSRAMRGFTSFRYRGNHRMLGSLEYRWTPARFMDMAIFYDAGKVAMRRSDLDFNDLESAYGIGARFHGPVGTIMRWELAHSREHLLRFIWTAGAPF
jgi:hypothetical protein